MCILNVFRYLVGGEARYNRYLFDINIFTLLKKVQVPAMRIEAEFADGVVRPPRLARLSAVRVEQSHGGTLALLWFSTFAVALLKGCDQLAEHDTQRKQCTCHCSSSARPDFEIVGSSL